MKRANFWTIILAITTIAIGFNSTARELQAQTESSVNIPLDDQARYLNNLENRSASQWSFSSPDRDETASQYTLSVSEPEVRLTEQKPPEWGNSGEDRNYSVLVDLDKFTNEFNEFIEPQEN